MTPTELRGVLERALTELAPADVPAFIVLLASVQAQACVRLPLTSAPVEPEDLGAEQLAAVFNVPVSQIYEQARQKRIPSVRVGKYVRFSLPAVRAALATGQDTETPSLGIRKTRSSNGTKSKAATAALPIEGAT
jgi:excisionase family DNA binding protein